LTGTAREVHRFRLPVDKDLYRISIKLDGTGQQTVYALGYEVELRQY